MQSASLKPFLGTVVGAVFCATTTSVSAGPGGECALFADGFESRVLLVDASAPAGGNGTSWPAAFNDLQDALAVAGSGDRIWLAAGTYKPVVPEDSSTATAAERAESFELISGISLLGRYTPDDCRGGNRGSAPTILSGDLLGDDLDTDADEINDSGLEDNSQHVLRADEVDAVALDGIVVSGGNSDGSSNRSGGGLLQEGGSLSMVDVEFVDNHSGLFGGGAGYANVDGVVAMSDVEFRNNNATSNGGGMSVSGDGSANVERAIFSNNRSRGNGGGAFTTGNTTVSFHDVSFAGNMVDTDGGGNGNGGGLGIDGGTTTISDAQFTENQVSKVGGGLNVRRGLVRLSHTVFFDNLAGTGGGGLYFSSQGGLVTIAYTLFANNNAANGGGIYTRGDISLTQSTLAGNASTGAGGAMYVLGGKVYGLNTIVWGNTAGTSLPGVRTLSDTTFSRSILQESLGSPWQNAPSGRGLDGAGNLDVDPLFVDPLDPDGPDDVFGTSDDGYALQAGSPARDLGTAADLADFDQDDSRREDLSDAADADGDGNVTEPPPWDLAGIARQTGHRVDLGAYEHPGGVSPSPQVIYVNAAAGAGGNGQSWGSAFDDLQDALAAAEGGDEIWVASGVYRPGMIRDDTFTLRPNVRVYGGFDGTETARADRDANPASNGTVLSGAILTGDVEDNSYHVVTAGGVGSASRLDGFTVTAGYDVQGGSGGWGGGIFNVTGAPTFANVLIRNNEALVGGGVYNRDGAQPRFVDSQFVDNVGWEGGAMHNRNAFVEIVGSQFIGNDGGAGGGGILNTSGGRLVISNSFFIDNESIRSLSSPGPGGGGILNTGGAEAAIQQVVFANNRASHGGALGNFSAATTRLNHVTFYDNEAIRGGAMSAWNGTDVSIQNSIFWENKLDTQSSPGNEEAAEIFAASNGSLGADVFLRNSIVDGGTSGPHIFVCSTCSVNDDGLNLADDPQFTNVNDLDGVDDTYGTSDDGLTLGPASAARDAGTSVDTYDIDWDGSTVDPLADFTDADRDGNYVEPISVDAAGGPRAVGPEMDIGAYEYDP